MLECFTLRRSGKSSKELEKCQKYQNRHKIKAKVTMETSKFTGCTTHIKHVAETCYCPHLSDHVMICKFHCFKFQYLESVTSSTCPSSWSTTWVPVIALPVLRSPRSTPWCFT